MLQILASGDLLTLDNVLDVGSTAVLAWLVWYCATKLVPKMIDKHTEAMQQQNATFERINREQREEFRTILEADRERALQREQALQRQFSEALDRFAAQSQE